MSYILLSTNSRLDRESVDHIVDQIGRYLLASGGALTARAVCRAWRKFTDAELARRATLTPLYDRTRSGMLVLVTGAEGLQLGILRVSRTSSTSSATASVTASATAGASTNVLDAVSAASDPDVSVHVLPLAGPCRLPLVRMLDVKPMDLEYLPAILERFPNLHTARIPSQEVSLMPLPRLVVDGTPALLPALGQVGKLVINVRGGDARHLRAEAPDVTDLRELVIIMHPKRKGENVQRMLASGVPSYLAGLFSSDLEAHVPSRWPRTVRLAVATLKSGGNVTIVNTELEDIGALFGRPTVFVSPEAVLGRSTPFTSGPAGAAGAAGPAEPPSSGSSSSSIADFYPSPSGPITLTPAMFAELLEGTEGDSGRNQKSLEDAIMEHGVRRTWANKFGELRSITLAEYVAEVGREELRLEAYFD